jgi:hypothetical protein
MFRVRDGKRERENCILVDLGYAGLRVQRVRPIGGGELLEFLVDIRSPVTRSGFVRGHVRWTRGLGGDECEHGVEFVQSSKGLLLGPDEKWELDVTRANESRSEHQKSS